MNLVDLQSRFRYRTDFLSFMMVGFLRHFKFFINECIHYQQEEKSSRNIYNKLQ